MPQVELRFPMSDDARRDPDQPEPNLSKPDEADLTGPQLAQPDDRSPKSEASEAEAASDAAAGDTFEQAGGAGPEPVALGETSDAATPHPPAKLERLQKILAQAGIASRRHAEELITGGRVQVNGQVVTELGSKADPERDHIRVDGKLLQGSERHRYFMLNKPKGFVTTVSDPEGRPTIMQFFAKMRERLYPVGRLDYMSEGLLLITNDGELANRLTRAASGVEKTYLVKVSGEPSEEDLERLREGISIDRGKLGSERVHTAPAEIRRFRSGKGGGRQAGRPRTEANPWFEVVLVEGRNRELRKMFEEIGHHVEKIRRVGYGPLVLDLEPGKFRELEPEEVENLRKAADGKYRKPKSREPIRHRESIHRNEGRPSEKPAWSRSRQEARPASRPGTREDRGRFRSEAGGRPNPNRSPDRSADRSADRGPKRGQFRSQPRGDFRPRTGFEAGRPPNPHRPSPDRPGQSRPRPDRAERPFEGTRDRRTSFPVRDRGDRPAWKNKPAHGSRPPRFEREARSERGGPRPNRSGDRGRPAEFRSAPPSARGPQRFGGRPNPGFSAKKRLEIHPADEEFGGRETGPRGRPQGRPDRPSFQSRSGSRPGSSRGPSAPRFSGKQRPQSDRDRREGPDQRTQRPRFDRDRPERSRSDRPKPGARTRPQTEEHRPSSGPRTGGFKRGGAGDRGGSSGSNRGGARSAGSRRPGSKPGFKSGSGPGGKPGGRRPGGGKRRP